MNKITLIIMPLICIEMFSLSGIAYADTLKSLEPKPATTIPSDATPLSSTTDKKYLLNIRVDGKVYSHPIWVTFKGNDFIIAGNDAEKLNIHAPSNHSSIDLNTLPAITVKYNPQYLALDIQTPANWQPTQLITVQKKPNNQFYRADVTPGFLLNYSLYGQSNVNSKYISAFLNTLYYSHYGYFVFSSEYNSSWIAGHKYSHFNRLNTSFIINNRSKAEQWIIGDFQSDQSHGFSSVYMAGVQYRKNYSLRPDIVTYPTLKIQGTASVPSAINLFVNGSDVKNNNVNVGPYVFNNIPFINGDGTITLVTTDQNGKKVVSKVPYYILTNLLKPGLSDFNLSLGALRYDYGLPDDHYQHVAVSGTYSRGITDDFTATTHLEATQHLALIGLGALINFNRFGNINTTLQLSHSYSKSGAEFYLSYNKNISNRSSLSFTHTQDIGDFYDLANFDSDNSIATLSDEAFYSYSFSHNMGSLGLGLVYLHTQDNNNTKILNLSYTTSVANLFNLSLSYSRNMGSNDNNNIALQIAIPFSGTSSFTEQYSNTLDGNAMNTMSVSQNVSNVNPLGWSFTFSNNNGENIRDGYKDLSGYWDSNFANIDAGIYGGSLYSEWGSIQGSLVLMNSHLFATKPLNGSFIAVSTNGIPNVPFYYNNSYEGKTNDKGIAFISDVLPYEKSDISIDPTSLPEDVTVNKLNKQLFIPDNAGYLVNFDLKKISPLLVIVKTNNAFKLESGDSVTNNQHSPVGTLGYGQQVYLPNAQRGATYQITNQLGQICHFKLPNTFTLFSSQSVICK